MKDSIDLGLSDLFNNKLRALDNILHIRHKYVNFIEAILVKLHINSIQLVLANCSYVLLIVEIFMTFIRW